MKQSTFHQVQANLVKTCVDAASMPGLNGPETSGIAAITVAFMLGIRFGMSKPNQAGEYMGRWIEQVSPHKEEDSIVALNHERAIQVVTQPIWNEE
jgi:rhamnogalacturonyl hydrolase YesR